MVVPVCLHITLPHYHNYAVVSEGIERARNILSSVYYDYLSYLSWNIWDCVY